MQDGVPGIESLIDSRGYQRKDTSQKWPEKVPTGSAVLRNPGDPQEEESRPDL